MIGAASATAGNPVASPHAARAVRETLAYYPGCCMHGMSPELDESLRPVLDALEIPIVEIDDWSCCGATSAHATDHLLGIALPARNLALAEAQGFASVLAPCAACYSRLALASLAATDDPAIAGRLGDVLGRPFANTVAVRSIVSLLRPEAAAIAERVAAASRLNPLADVKLAAYYGCLLVRPPEVADTDDPEAPTSMDELLAACGAEPVDWNMKVECCGGGFSVCRTTSVVRLGRAIVEDARRHGAEAIVVACPLCHSNLDLRQRAMIARGDEPLPVLFLTQVVGIALGLPASALGLGRHFVDAESFARRLVERAVARAADERRRAAAATKAAAEAAAPATRADP